MLNVVQQTSRLRYPVILNVSNKIHKSITNVSVLYKLFFIFQTFDWATGCTHFPSVIRYVCRPGLANTRIARGSAWNSKWRGAVWDWSGTVQEKWGCRMAYRRKKRWKSRVSRVLWSSVIHDMHPFKDLTIEDKVKQSLLILIRRILSWSCLNVV